MAIFVAASVYLFLVRFFSGTRALPGRKKTYTEVPQFIMSLDVNIALCGIHFSRLVPT